MGCEEFMDGVLAQHWIVPRENDILRAKNTGPSF
jgi:hypothetical protein